MTSLSILVLTTVVPDEQRGSTGGEIVTSHMITGLRNLGHSVQVLGYGRTGYKTGENETVVDYRPIETRDAPIQAARWLASALMRGRSYSIEKYVSSAYRDALADALRMQQWDRVILDHAQTAWALPALSGQRIIHLSHNNEAGLYTERATTCKTLARFVFWREAQLMNLAEKTISRAAHSVWTLTHENANYFKRLGAKSTVALPIPPRPLPMGFHHEVPKYDIGLLGTWSWGPNRAGLDWFCQKVVPLLPSKLKIAVAGRGAEDLKDCLPNLLVLGRIEEAGEFLSKVRCIAVPSVAGDGIQIKTLDAISIGRPVVVTRHALRGIEDVPLRVRTAETPEFFATALQDALKNPEILMQDDWAATRLKKFISILKDALL